MADEKMGASSKEALLSEIAREEALLESLRGQEAAVRARLQGLRDQLAGLVETPPRAVGPPQLLRSSRRAIGVVKAKAGAKAAGYRAPARV